MKVCTKCGESKPPKGFNRDRQSTDRLQGFCKPCQGAVWAEKAAVSTATSAAIKRAGRAAPPWLTDEHRAQMAALYREARLAREHLGGTVHVDHVYPLKGRGVCGLHVPWNLRILDGVENIRKGNKLLPDAVACATIQ